MSDTYEINEFDQVVPYTSGRRCNDTRAWRDATELELEQRGQIAKLERQRNELLEALESIADLSQVTCMTFKQQSFAATHKALAAIAKVRES